MLLICFYVIFVRGNFLGGLACFVWGLESRAYLCPPFLGSLFPFLTVVFMPCLSGINFPGYAKPPFLFLPLKKLFLPLINQ